MIILKKNEKIELKLLDLKKLIKFEISFPVPMFDFKDDSGIYFLYDFSKSLIYVGKITNIRNRLVTHMTKSTRTSSGSLSKEQAETIKFWSFIRIDNHEIRDIAEHIYIFLYKPKYNKTI